MCSFRFRFRFLYFAPQSNHKTVQLDFCNPVFWAPKMMDVHILLDSSHLRSAPQREGGKNIAAVAIVSGSETH